MVYRKTNCYTYYSATEKNIVHRSMQVLTLMWQNITASHHPSSCLSTIILFPFILHIMTVPMQNLLCDWLVTPQGSKIWLVAYFCPVGCKYGSYSLLVTRLSSKYNAFVSHLTYDLHQRYRQGNICRIHPAVRAIYIYCTVITTQKP